ncbi:hypothetical protein L596_019581 [Steinernema carpocapsae]|uniref:Reverse transcriptase domain-containing protein n=1 Tax=Steinernema carpocapsae TaxID=34508 RepID=A0A4V6XVZ1_STECR|nr:hypothetical protein L596_019581 [Steinernema carpocapsae]
MTMNVMQTRAGLDLVGKQVDAHMEKIQKAIDESDELPNELMKQLELCTKKLATLTTARVKSLETLKTLWRKKFSDYDKAVKALPEGDEADTEMKELRDVTADFAQRLVEYELLILQANEYISDWSDKLTQFREAQAAGHDASVLMNQTSLTTLNASPFILAQTIVHHLDHFVKDENLKNEIKANLYVDNLMVTAETLEEALEKYLRTKKTFNDIKMNLRDFSSNNQELMTLIPEKDRAKSVIQKVLGIPWDTAEDVLEVICHFPDEERITKRTTLRQHAQNFDPVGFLTPLLIKSKMFNQNLWKKDYGWDVPLKEDDRQEWIQLKKNISGFRKQLSRNCRGLSEQATLVVFSDSNNTTVQVAVKKVGNPQLKQLVYPITPDENEGDDEGED